jgi:plastocyanin
MTTWNGTLTIAVLLTIGVSMASEKMAEANAERQAAADTTITVRAVGSTLEFTPTRISAKAGSRVRIRFVNDGTLPHNLVVPRDEDDIDVLALAAYSASETGYVPEDKKDKLIGWTALASPGQSVETIITVPAAGEYTYVCLFPGHSNSMLGTLRALTSHNF